MSTAPACEPRLVVLQSSPVWLPLTATWLCNQVRHLPSDIESHVICERTEHLEQFDVPNIHDLSRAPAWRRAWERALDRLRVRRHRGWWLSVARRAGARILHSHWGDVGWRDVPVARKAGLRHVVTFYGKDVNYFPQVWPGWRERYRELFAAVHAVVCEGEHMGRCIVELGCVPEKVRVLRLGVEVDKIRFEPRSWDGRGPLRFLIAASFREKKGIPDALDAIGLFRADGVDVEVTIIGDASADPRSHPEKRRILETIERRGLGPCTRLLGYQPHEVLFREAYRHHIFVSPSLTARDGDTEGGAPVTIIEMAASGMPIVSTRHCDIPSVIVHGETGFLAGERDVPGLLEHLRALAARPDSWRAIVEAGRRRIEAEFDVRKQAEKLAALYREVAEAGGGA